MYWLAIDEHAVEIEYDGLKTEVRRQALS
jgi:hypothetical protein